jgi:xanthine dehydrogenase YagS FAD-binding subunit
VPWRAHDAERVLDGAVPSEELFRRAAEVALSDAVTTAQNAFKPELVRRAIVRALTALV